MQGWLAHLPTIKFQINLVLNVYSTQALALLSSTYLRTRSPLCLMARAWSRVEPNVLILSVDLETTAQRTSDLLILDILIITFSIYRVGLDTV